MTAKVMDMAEMVRNLTPAQLHPKVVQAAEMGLYTILDLFDTLPWFKTGADWTAWRAFLCALFGLSMTEVELAIYRRCTGRTAAPTRGATEAWVAVGRRGRKSAVAALIGIWFAAYRCDYTKLIAPGETARVVILSKSKDDAKQIHSYASAILGHPSTAYLLNGEPLGESIQLKVPTASGSYKVEIVIRAATIMAGRTRTVLAALLDEVAFFRTRCSLDSRARTRAVASFGRRTKRAGPRTAPRSSGRPQRSRCTTRPKSKPTWTRRWRRTR